MELINILKTLNFEAIFWYQTSYTRGYRWQLCLSHKRRSQVCFTERIWRCSHWWYSQLLSILQWWRGGILKIHRLGILPNSGEVLRLRGSSNRGASICVRTILAIRWSGNSALAFRETIAIVRTNILMRPQWKVAEAEKYGPDIDLRICTAAQVRPAYKNFYK